VLGLIVNPVAGLGGRVGLKGSDGIEIQRRARELGAMPLALERAATALQRFDFPRASMEIMTYPGEMGEGAARACGFEPTVIGSIQPGSTSAEDTMAAAREMQRRGVRLILFAGGDGTARDMVRAIGDSVPVLGIPAGVKILSAAFATSPTAAGELARGFLAGEVARLREAEVLDLDEEAYRAGRLSQGALPAPPPSGAQVPQWTRRARHAAGHRPGRHRSDARRCRLHRRSWDNHPPDSLPPGT